MDKEVNNTKIRKAGYIACSVIFGITLSALCLFLAVYMVAFNRTIYHNSMVREAEKWYDEKNLTDEQVADFNTHGLTQAQLDYVIDDVLKYLVDGREIMDTQIEGYGGELFTEKEISHMVDVKAIFTGIKWITVICAVIAPLALAGVIFTGKEHYKKRHKRLFVFTLIGNAVFIGAIVLFMLINFENTFIVFHKLLFTNDNWWLSSTDLLIEMLPGDLFMRLGLYISATYITLLLASCLTGFFQKRIGAFFKRVFKKRDADAANSGD